ncbi:Predicted heme/steroid binding protein [Fervidobacterium changbaicum]|uniref:Cytochrome B5 n=2 Tax=Fervidobacterium TaxID=2422 RepID=A0AAI8GCS2_FERIS|nr:MULTISPECIES: cytochrome b5 domain-containing protein [Fervidobacterium]AMW32600.1 cytochrome B5 [Fervidobacterium islandicum]QAV32546.1 cytochrome B5 [Fervidobacterium changbaicum]SDH51992.1 Predicted heme/steroid binding protein [Fervidobacterium changbaicum]
MRNSKLTAVLFLLIASASILLAGHLDSYFNIQKFKGEYKIISSETLQKASGWVSVEGVVYNLGTSAPAKKQVKLSEIDAKQLSNDKIVGLLGITISELSKYNGKNAPTMVAVSGIVYDLSSSKSWSGGNHKNQHVAGQDLTYDILKLSPHGISRIKSFPSYGVLVFTPDELIKYNGKKDKKIYVSVFGIVYDATYSKRFSNGEHYGHDMGVDLTSEILSLQGHVSLLNKLYAIGLYVFNEKSISKFNGKDNKPFVIVKELVYDISRNSQGIQSGSVFDGQPRQEWLLVGFKLN